MARIGATCCLLLVLATACTGPNPAWRFESVQDAAPPDQAASVTPFPNPDGGPSEILPVAKDDGGEDTGPAVGGATDADDVAPVGSPDAGKDAAPQVGASDAADKVEVAPEAAIEVAPPIEVAPLAPPQIVLVGATETPKRGGDGGRSYVDECGPNQAVVGLAGSFQSTNEDDLIGSIQVVCGELRLPSAVPGTLVDIGVLKSLTRRGNTRAVSWNVRCPDHQVVVAYDGRSGLFLDQVRFRCARLALSADGTSLAIDSTTTALPAAGGEGGSSFRVDACSQRQIAHGANIRAGDYVDAFSLVCATPTLVR